jgi:4-amino-4-deoxy-L-arabinose transferase-like glycosyltransferase
MNSRQADYVIISILSALLFIPFLGGVHLFDWDEINFAESAREMIISGDYLNVSINFKPFWEKPPLYIWMQVFSMKLFGINEFAARFPNAVCGIATLLLLYRIGFKYRGQQFARLWVLAFGGSILPFLYFKSGIIDPWFNLFIFLGFVKLTTYLENPGPLNALLSGLFIGLAILTKGPVALLVFLLAAGIYVLVKRFRFEFRWVDIGWFLLALSFIGGLWFLLQILSGNLDIVRQFISYQIRLFQTKDAGHGGFLLYHFVVLFLGVFPASVFALKAVVRPKPMNGNPDNFYLLMFILFWVVLILFTIVRTKIVHYSSLCYFPLTFFAAWVIEQYLSERKPFTRWQVLALYFIASLIVLLTGALAFFNYYKDWVIASGRINDPFAIGNLEANIHWTGFEALTALPLLAGLVYFAFTNSTDRQGRGVIVLFVASAIYLNSLLIVYVPRIEGYSQRAAIEFFKTLKGKNVYVGTIGYKSYAHYFYASVTPAGMAGPKVIYSLTDETPDKDAWFSSKITHIDHIHQHHPTLQLVYKKNGFAFWIRQKSTD